MSQQQSTLYVELGDRRYPIHIGEDLLTSKGLLAGLIKSRQVVVITNETIAPLYLDIVLGQLPDSILVTPVIIPDGEQYKTWQTLGEIFDQVLVARHNRSTTFVALGGGVVGDITGFAAACYQRGVNFIQIPTTLLAQVDSSVGGKTAVNHSLGKNMIGAFYQPTAVVIDTGTLSTLGAREYAAGLAEVVKYGLIYDAEFHAWICANRSQLVARDGDTLRYAIQRSCEVKAEVVAADERESGLRAILNLGHTFGHAIETHMGYGSWLHGEAVAAGMVMAVRLSALRGSVDAELVVELEQLLVDLGLPVWAPTEMRSETFIDLMALDKKAIDGQMRFVLLGALGSALVVDDVTEAELVALIDS
ncbi:MAG: 3-dehydroquinate synthase [Halieaceae bacterium]|nr:3-dehydroquinate synthase [Halieaceae bacterium]